MLKSLIPVVALFTSVLAAPSVGFIQGDIFTSPCGSDLTREQATDAEARLNAKLESKGLTLADYSPASRASRVSAERVATPVNVYFHNIYSSTAASGGYLTDAQIASTISSLNSQLNLTGVTFRLAGTTRTQNSQWFTSAGPNLSTGAENTYAVAMKNSLRTGGVADLNLYTVAFSGSLSGLLGYATFPWWYEDEPEYDGVVYRYDTTPGSTLANYNTGKTLAHEVGHWLGLYHVFQGGCSGSGDFVSDTPPQAGATSGCPTTNPDTCPGGGVDSIHNFMDYTIDVCKYEWSAGQVTRLTAAIDVYRGIV